MAGPASRVQALALGRPVTDTDKIEAAHAMRDAGQSVAVICRTLGISKATFYRHAASGV